jgi:hypothetical protein
MLNWFKKTERDESLESRLAEMTGVDEMLIHAVRFSGEKLQNIFDRAKKNDRLDMGGKVSLGTGLVLLGVGMAKAGTFGLVGGVSLMLVSLVPVFMAQVGKSKLASEIKQAGLDRLVSDYKVTNGISESVIFDTPRSGGQINKMTVT